MRELPLYGNHIIQYETGDGFRSALPALLTKEHLVITSTRLLEEFGRQSRSTTTYRLAKLLAEGNPPEINIVLDIRIPRISSEAFKSLRQLCEGRNLTVLHSPLYDVESLSTLLVLLSLTQRRALNSVKWDQFQYSRGRRGY